MILVLVLVVIVVILVFDLRVQDIVDDTVVGEEVTALAIGQVIEEASPFLVEILRQKTDEGGFRGWVRLQIIPDYGIHRWRT